MPRGLNNPPALPTGAVVSTVCRGFGLGSLDHDGLEPDADVAPGQPGRYPSLDIACNAQVWLYCIGFIVSYGSLFAKLWRVTKILIKTLDKVEKVLMELAPPEWWEEYQKQPGRARARMLRSLRAGVLPTQRKPWAWSWKERAGKGNGGQWDFWSR